MSWTASSPAAPAQVARPARFACLPTRRTAAAPTAHTCAAAESRATIPERRDQQANRARRGSRGGRPPAFDKVAYKRRNVVERCLNRFKQYRAIATRYDKTAMSYQGMIDLATLRMWL
jgi:transposase